MKGKINQLATQITTVVCTKMAMSVSASACFWAEYQPEEPKCLKNK